LILLPDKIHALSAQAIRWQVCRPTFCELMRLICIAAYGTLEISIYVHLMLLYCVGCS
jgi:hypothetical protein